MYPENYRYTKDHEWVSVESGIGTVGITDHAQNELGEIVFVDMAKATPGKRIEKGQVLGAVESVKAVSDVFSPVSGEILEINAALAQTPDLVNKDPHGAAWLAKIRLSAPDELGGLMTAAVYEAYVAAEK